jgi:hypothetical protein
MVEHLLGLPHVWLPKLAARHRHRPLTMDARLVTDAVLDSWRT